MTIYKNRNDVLSDKVIERLPKLAQFWSEWKDSFNLVTFHDDGVRPGFDHMNHTPESISQVNYLSELIVELGMIENTGITSYVNEEMDKPWSSFHADPHIKRKHKTIKRYTILDLMKEYHDR